MRHLCSNRRLSRSTSHRRALFRNMATALVLNEKIETTLAKAKELRPILENLITRAKRDVLHNRRTVHHYLKDKEAAVKLFVDIAPRLQARSGGYTRIVRSRARTGDAAPLAVIEILKDAGGAKKPKKKKARGVGATSKEAKPAAAESAAESSAGSP